MTEKPRNGYVQRNGLLIPETVELRDNLAQQRHAAAVIREDKQARRAGTAYHRNRLAEITEKAAAARRARRDRKRDTREQADLNRLYQVAIRSGTRARIRADIQRSAEMRALRVSKVRSVALVAGIPILAAFAAWSTAGAQAGAVRLLQLQEGSPGWAAAWGIEPALISIVALIIIGRAVLKASGGTVDWKATAIEWAALGTSLGLNIFGGWTSGWAGVATVLPHAIGPTFCALTALLIGLFVGYATQARPWDDAPRLTDMGFVADRDIPAADAHQSAPGDDLAEIAQLPSTQTVIEVGAPDETRSDAPGPKPRHRRRGPAGARRTKTASTVATSGDAHGDDAATRAARLVLTRGLSNRQAALEVGGTSEASVRRRVNKLRETQRAEPSGDAPDDPDGESAERVITTPLTLPLTDPAAATARAVNGHRPNLTEEH